MARTGRTRKLGLRYPSGNIKRTPQEEAKWDAMSIVLTKRCRDLGLRPTLDHMRAVRNEQLGYLIGQLRICRKITEPQFEAGKRYGLQYDAFVTANGTPIPFPQAAAFDRVSGRTPDVDSERDAEIVGDFYEARSALARAGILARNAVEDACIHDRPAGMYALRTGLNALTTHYGLTRNRQ